MDYLGNSKINQRDYNRWGDRNAIGDHMDPKLLRWVDSKNTDRTDLAKHAEIVSEKLGVHVTPEDFIHVIDTYTGREHFNEANKSETQRLLEKRYEELTGNKLTPYKAEKAYTGKFKVSAKELSEADKELQHYGITIKEIQDHIKYEKEYEQSQRNGSGEKTPPTNNNAKVVQQTENDGVGNAGKNRPGEGVEGSKRPTKKTGFKKSAEQSKVGEALRSLADKVEKGQINKLGGFRASTGFDAVWDTSLKVVAETLRGGAKIADAIEAGLKHIRQSDWYKNLTDKKDFEQKYTDHMNKELGGEGKTGIRHADTEQEREELGVNAPIDKKDRSKETIDAKGKELVNNDEFYAEKNRKGHYQQGTTCYRR
eukprot:gnl/Spiro4/14839_TR7998_c0_g1_i1.p1 gnl/Spiro4/14839_TR7998_c0_g1~~gnl/Spiro4/14839_TR7998_c0_g1_i1.p1  ORF type:complete len:424 (-),score=-13.19 gnl/Spiro4/14839_TR7998_c0_g1_i1:611-1714(-)